MHSEKHIIEKLHKSVNRFDADAKDFKQLDSWITAALHFIEPSSILKHELSITVAFRKLHL